MRGGATTSPGVLSTEGGLMIDLAEMKRIVVDPRLGRPAPKVGELERVQRSDRRARVGGDRRRRSRQPGRGPHPLGGGLGWLIEGAGVRLGQSPLGRLVTASGEVLDVTQESSRISSALRGGGGNFSVATQFGTGCIA